VIWAVLLWTLKYLVMSCWEKHLKMKIYLLPFDWTCVGVELQKCGIVSLLGIGYAIFPDPLTWYTSPISLKYRKHKSIGLASMYTEKSRQSTHLWQPGQNTIMVWSAFYSPEIVLSSLIMGSIGGFAGSIRMAVHSTMGASEAIDLDNRALQSASLIYNREW
jgi:hypothetical protein